MSKDITDDFLFIVIGNTTVRWRTAGATAPRRTGCSAVNDPPQESFGRLASRCRCIVCSVNPKVLSSLSPALPPSTQVAGVDFPVPITNRTRIPGQVGIDRLIAALGAWKKYGACLVVDIGTAVTVDLVDDGPVFEGGAILPGPRLWTEALHEKTALLPDVRIPEPPAYSVGRTTDEAVTSGVYWGLVGAVTTLIKKMAGARTDITLCLTGGGAALFAGSFCTEGVEINGRRCIMQEEPDLLFLGLEACVRGT